MAAILIGEGGTKGPADATVMLMAVVPFARRNAMSG